VARIPRLPGAEDSVIGLLIVIGLILANLAAIVIFTKREEQ
jgi:hypothetical protein